MEQRKACQRCRNLKQACVDHDGVSCVKCHKAGTNCSLSPGTMLSTSGKRKIEDIGDKSGRAIRKKRATSFATVSHIDALNASSRMGGPKPLQQLNNTPNKKSKSGSWKCGICEKNDRKGMIQCENKTCNSWCHNTCVRSCEDPRHRLFALALNFRNWKFICPKCVDEPDGYFSQEIADFSLVMERINKRVDSQNNSSQRTEDPKRKFQTRTDLGLIGEMVPGFEPAKEERFRGLVEAKVFSLMSNIDQSIYDYNREVVDTFTRFSGRNEEDLMNPLTDWKLIDSNEDAAAGRSWYSIPWEETEGRTRNQSRSHHPITAALRSMLRTINGKPLEVDRSLLNLSFSQVYTGFVGWFVIEVVANKLDLYELPNMVPMRAMMAAVKEFAEFRWPKKGNHSLREVQLRTWYKASFNHSMRSDEGNLRRRMEAFLDPLTSEFERISRWSHHQADIIQHTIELWTYLESVRGDFKPILPKIGSVFNPREHEAFDQNGMQLDPDIGAKILWLLRPGFKVFENPVNKITENPGNGIPDVTVKARVFLE